MRKIIDDCYNYYVDNISDLSMPISPDVAYFLWDYLIKFQPIKILERGSGFSTFIFALYKKMNTNKKVYLHSIDSHLKWLIKTDYFLRLNNLEVDVLEIYDKDKEFNRKFDLIFEDTKAKIRKKTIEDILNLRDKNGTIIFDDANAHGYLSNKSSDLLFSELKDIKQDHRYPAITTNNEKQLKWAKNY